MIKPIKSGAQQYGSSCGMKIVWNVFSTHEAELQVGWVADTGNTEFAERLLGRKAFDNGRTWANDPEIKVFGKKLIVSQVTGEHEQVVCPDCYGHCYRLGGACQTCNFVGYVSQAQCNQ